VREHMVMASNFMSTGDPTLNLRRPSGITPNDCAPGGIELDREQQPPGISGGYKIL